MYTYRYLKRIFKDLFERAGYEDDGIYDWDLSLKARSDGTFGLEGLKYGSPRECGAGDGAAAPAGNADVGSSATPAHQAVC